MFATSSPARLRGLGLIALAAVSWGTTGSVTALLVARAEATPLVVGAARVLVAAVLLLAAAGASRRRHGEVTGGLCPAPRPLSGVILALGAGFAYALYVVLAKAALARTAPLPLAALTFAVAAVLLAPALATSGAGRQLVLGWPGLLYLGAVTTAGAYAVYMAGLRHVTAAGAGVAALLEPLTATLLGVVVFGERLGVVGWAGAVLLLGALVLRADAERR